MSLITNFLSYCCQDTIWVAKRMLATTTTSGKLYPAQCQEISTLYDSEEQEKCLFPKNLTNLEEQIIPTFKNQVLLVKMGEIGQASSIQISI